MSTQSHMTHIAREYGNHGYLAALEALRSNPATAALTLREFGDLEASDEFGMLWTLDVGWFAQNHCLLLPGQEDRWKTPPSTPIIDQDEPPVADAVLFIVEVVDPCVSATYGIVRRWLSVPPTMLSPREAVAWTFSMSELLYSPVVEL